MASYDLDVAERRFRIGRWRRLESHGHTVIVRVYGDHSFNELVENGVTLFFLELLLNPQGPASSLVLKRDAERHLLGDTAVELAAD